MKTRKTVYWESQLERDAIVLFETDPSIRTYSEQPFTLEYRHAGRIHHYTPDFKVKRQACRQIVEVKPDKEAALPENQERFALVAKLLLEHGYDFAVLTESEIRIQPRLANAKLLLRYRCTPVTDVVKERLRRLFTQYPSPTIKWFDDHPEFGVGFAEIASLICSGYLAIEMNTLIGSNTTVWLQG